MLEQQLLAEFGRRLRAETADKLTEMDGDTPLLRATALADVMIGYLEEAATVSEHELCPYEDVGGRSRCRIIGYSLPAESTRLELFTAAVVGDDGANLPSAEVGSLTGRAARFFHYAATGDVARFAGNEEVAAAAQLISDRLESIEEVRVHVLTNGSVKDRFVDDSSVLCIGATF